MDLMRKIIILCTLAFALALTAAQRAQREDEKARTVTIKNLKAQDVNVRLMGDFAIIHARTSYTAGDGSEGGGRYTDVWARRNGKWVAVSAHVTRR